MGILVRFRVAYENRSDASKQNVAYCIDGKQKSQIQINCQNLQLSPQIHKLIDRSKTSTYVIVYCTVYMHQKHHLGYFGKT